MALFRNFGLFFLVVGLTRTSVSIAAEKEFLVSTHLGLNVLSFFTSPIGHSDNSPGPLFGAKVDYFFIPPFGVFLGADLLKRGTPLIGGDLASAAFIDIPFGISLNHGEVFLPKQGVLISRLGGYYSSPLSDMKVGSTLIQRAANSFGAYLGSGFYFSISKSLLLGGTVWTKVGITKTLSVSQYGSSERVIELGLAGSALFDFL